MSDAAENIQPDSWKLKAVREAMPDLRALWQRKDDATVAFRDACKGIAEKSNMDKEAIGAYVNAVMRDKEKERHDKAEQLQLLIDDI